MSKKDRIIKVCVCCHKELDAAKDKELFVEAEGKVVCKSHHGAAEWFNEVSKATVPVPESPVAPA